MRSSLIQQIGLISESDRVDLEELMIVSAALQKQVSRDFSSIWEVDCTVDAFGSLDDLPLGYWPVIIMDDIGFDGAAGIHLDRDGQPFALVTSSDDNDVWSLTASHEVLEMLADPFGDRLVAGDSPHPDQGRVMFLVEVCDPSEAAQFGYSVNGVLVSDFYTPRFFDPVFSTGTRYSFTDAITEPRQVLVGGYLSWLDPVSNHWWQETWFRGTSSKFVDLGELTVANGSIRSQIDRINGAETHLAIETGREHAMAAGLTSAVLANSTSARAESLRSQIAELVGGQVRGARANGSKPVKRRSARRSRTNNRRK